MRIIVHIQVEDALAVLGLDQLSDSEILRHLIEIVSAEEVLDGARWRVERVPECAQIAVGPRMAS